MARSITDPSKTALKVRKDDLYQTHPRTVLALLEQVDKPIKGLIWEPACGPGAIVKALRHEGFDVIATDLVDYKERRCPDSVSGVDFLMETAAPPGVDVVMTNPPYKLAGEFVRHALRLGVPRVLMLLRLTFMETNASRNDILDGGLWAAAHVFRDRIPMMHSDEWLKLNPTTDDAPDRLEKTPTAYAWFDWRRHHGGPPIINRITWEPKTRGDTK